MRTPAFCHVDTRAPYPAQRCGSLSDAEFQAADWVRARCFKSEAKVPFDVWLLKVIDADASLTMFGLYPIMGTWEKISIACVCFGTRSLTDTEEEIKC